MMVLLLVALSLCLSNAAAELCYPKEYVTQQVIHMFVNSPGVPARYDSQIWSNYNAGIARVRMVYTLNGTSWTPEEIIYDFKDNIQYYWQEDGTQHCTSSKLNSNFTICFTDYTLKDTISVAGIPCGRYVYGKSTETVATLKDNIPLQSIDYDMDGRLATLSQFYNFELTTPDPSVFAIPPYCPRSTEDNAAPSKTLFELILGKR
eukprot:TRINITY_DN15119_c0_g2_i1.p1 TRINITY_DN15119_c0_g2~~TRINITY_DN15119_c0_g2_i1.p1  ORF type:complete len:205 (+),score=32.33 TRINITY_DN15119_c0_g2_i1:149-763(+)